MMRRRLVWLLVLLTLVAGCNGNWSSGDRVLVSKFAYDADLGRPRRYDVVVFRCPEPPQRGGPLDNFIKRLLGLAGETLAIFFGHIFVTTDWQPPGDLDAEHASLDPTRADPLELWRPEYMYRDDRNARALFRQGRFTPRGARAAKTGKFEILRKDPETMLALRRIVYDTDHPAADLEQAHFPARWAGRKEGSWAHSEDKSFRGEGKGKDVAWLDYHHILRPLDWPGGQDRPHRAQLITDFSGYNSYEKQGQRREIGGNWVGDLMLDFEVTADGSAGELWLELARGVDRFRARWNLADGKCTLFRLQDGKKDPEQLKSAPTRLKGPGTYRVRFANFDERLTVWVDGDLPFGDGCAYERSWYFDPDKVREDGRRGAFVNVGPTDNDRRPASVGSKGAAVTVRHLQLWRNTYYTVGGEAGPGWDARLPQPDIPDRLREAILPPDSRERAALVAEHWEKFWSTPSQWGPLERLNFATLYVQKGHYLCMGDNSPESHDSRAWGTVPERLMLGRALMVYYPFTRAGLIR